MFFGCVQLNVHIIYYSIFFSQTKDNDCMNGKWLIYYSVKEAFLRD